TVLDYGIISTPKEDTLPVRLGKVESDRQLRLADTMKSLANEGRTVVSVLHDIILAMKISDQIAVMENGSIVFTGTPDELLAQKILPRIFHVDLLPVICEGETEYVYRKVLDI
ncbi:MAG: hypothetical protein IKD07_02965, partial [Clostridia bacterium]|nr:hypothetical protein [Clostridia bacterium]